jgi:Predicted membrane protein (DUF2232)
VVGTLVAAGVSVLLYHLGIGLPAFLIPLQVVRVRRGAGHFLAAAALSFTAIGGVRLALSRDELAGAGFPALVLEMSVVLGMLAGLAWIQMPELLRRPAQLPGGRVARLLVAAAAAGLAAVPLISYLGRNQEFAAGLSKLFDAAAALLNRLLDPSGGEAGFRGEELAAMTRVVFLRSFLLDYVLVLTFCWWAGTVLGARSLGRRPEVTPLARFRPAEGLIWPLIVGLALVLLNLVLPLGPLELAGWNLLLVMLFFYGLAGLGILRFLLDRLGAPRGMRLLTWLVLVVLAFAPGVNAALAVLISGLGVSETWINYRDRERSKA